MSKYPLIIGQYVNNWKTLSVYLDKIPCYPLDVMKRGITK